MLHTGEGEARPDSVSKASAWNNTHPGSHTLSKQSLVRREERHCYTAGARKEKAGLSPEGDSKATPPAWPAAPVHLFTFPTPKEWDTDMPQPVQPPVQVTPAPQAPPFLGLSPWEPGGRPPPELAAMLPRPG